MITFFKFLESRQDVVVGSNVIINDDRLNDLVSSGTLDKDPGVGSVVQVNNDDTLRISYGNFSVDVKRQDLTVVQKENDAALDKLSRGIWWMIGDLAKLVPSVEKLVGTKITFHQASVALDGLRKVRAQLLKHEAFKAHHSSPPEVLDRPISDDDFMSAVIRVRSCLTDLQHIYASVDQHRKYDKWNNRNLDNQWIDSKLVQDKIDETTSSLRSDIGMIQRYLSDVKVHYVKS